MAHDRELLPAEMFRVPAGTEMTAELLSEYLAKHSRMVAGRYSSLDAAYENDYEIWHYNNKPNWKPDNRVPVNFAKYITDTMNGFFLGIPIKVSHEDQTVNDYLNFLDKYNDQEDNNAELSKICSEFGRGYEMYYVNEEGNIGITYLSPMDAFMIYDESILERPLYFVRRYKDSNGVEWGSYSDANIVRHFKVEGSVKWIDDEQIHGFDDVPATEYVENEERMGIYESVLPMINAYNKAISEKSDDVDYFADAYLKILGAELKQDQLNNLRDKRIINFAGADSTKLDVDFLSKPNGDTTQENLLDRLERLIFQISMVANISDEDFGSSSGVALKYKLQAMSNLAKTKERKFTSGMNRRYKLIFSNPVSGMREDAWTGIQYKFTQNYPANVLEESQIAGNLAGITSKETQLKVLSIIDDVQSEINQIKKDQDEESYDTDYPTNRTTTEDK